MPEEGLGVWLLTAAGKGSRAARSGSGAGIGLYNNTRFPPNFFAVEHNPSVAFILEAPKGYERRSNIGMGGGMWATKLTRTNSDPPNLWHVAGTALTVLATGTAPLKVPGAK